MTEQQAARIAHEVNRAYCQRLGDDSQLPWDEAPEWQKQSAVNGITMHWKILSEGGKVAPSASHDSWLAEKVANGWRYGPVKAQRPSATDRTGERKMMHWNYQLSEEEIEAIVTKMDELNGPFSEESTDPLREKRKAALRGWLIIGVKDMLTAMQALDYGIVRVKTGVFIETHECNAALAQSQVPASLRVSPTLKQLLSTGTKVPLT